jgi:mRNA interferase MazF
MAALKPGDVVILDFVGAVQTKRRPPVVLSRQQYQDEHSDVVVALLTTRLDTARTTADYVLKDWTQAGLDQPSAFRAYITTPRQTHILQTIGRLSDRDWKEVQERVRRALELD